MALFQLYGSLRIGNGLGFGSANQAGLGETPAAAPYPEKLVKLFPVEGVGLTTLVVGLGGSLLALSVILTVLIAAGVFVVRMFATKPTNGGNTDWWAVGIATVSYFMYAVSVGAFSTFGNPQALATSMGVIIGVWTFVVPFFPTKS